ncbi:MAG: molybdopterin molybdenumtransferase MoeA [Paracoccaceae bacterium]
MSLFDSYITVDWSGGNDTGPTPRADAIWVCAAGEAPLYLRNRISAEDWLKQRLAAERAAGRRVLVGFDFAFGYPEGFAKAVTGSADPLALWDWFEARVEDAPKSNNRFDLAAELNARFPGIGPFWGNGLARDIENLPRKGRARYGSPFSEKRAVEDVARGSFAVWQLSGAGAVGSQVIMGVPVLARLRRAFGTDLSVWPFEEACGGIRLVEIWPSLLREAVAQACGPGDIKDAVQVQLTSNALREMDLQGRLEPALLAGSAHPVEGWILGVGAEAEMEQAVKAVGMNGSDKKLLRNDCFALPQGVSWTPVDEALEHLRSAMVPVVGREDVALSEATGRVLAQDLIAARANPPAPNSAVDGYGFAARSLPDSEVITLPLVEGRAAAGAPYRQPVPAGSAIRILTGALLPDGVDTVVLEEDCDIEASQIFFGSGVKPGANTRKAGEDIDAGALALSAGHRMRPQDIAFAAAVGVPVVPVFRNLRVGVISTGDELAAPAADVPPDRTFDANRPMLLQLAERWGYTSVDLGHVADDRALLRARFDEAAQRCDVVLTSGGASAGDEDHVSALLRETGALNQWRIALKPGRPLAMGLWQGVPVFGLPGNPVAAFVCSLIFARPAMSLLSGGQWSQPVGFMVPAAFSKSKKPGRREFLRARLNAEGQAEVFASEGSGRISGLSWSEGLVELPDGKHVVKPGDPVRYMPYGSFGI